MEQLQEDPEKEGFYMFQSGFTLPDEEEVLTSLFCPVRLHPHLVGYLTFC